MKVLIVTPSFGLVGGVANHYLGLRAFWTSDVRYEFYGKRKSIPAPLTLPLDLCKYFFKLLFSRPDVVIVNPSLRNYQLFRDGIYLVLARMLRVPVVTFIHGWDPDVAKQLETKGSRFRKVYNRSLFMYVLAEEFRAGLLKIGITAPILLTTTKINDQLLNGFTLEDAPRTEVKEVLFLARIVKEKGIYIALEAFQLLTTNYPQLVLRIVGDGPELANARKWVDDNQLKNVRFEGPVFGEAIREEFTAAQVFLLPTYGEGMPTAVLEAMAFGMFVITRPVGGLNDFFRVPEMGRLIASFEPEAYAAAIEELLLNPEKLHQVARFNHVYAREHFMASKVAAKIETDLNNALGRK